MPRRDGWSEMGGYMPAKIQKLNRQFDDVAKKQISDIFSGICIFVNGLTDPPDSELRSIMSLHGGRFCHYYSKDVVTHMVATNLTQSKISNLTNEKVVKPDWIVESVQAGRLLDWSDYELYGERHKSDQNMMKRFVTSKTSYAIPERTVYPVIESNNREKELDTGAFSLSEFYAKSRLHHLSTWANQLNSYLQQLKLSQCEQSTDPTLIFHGRNKFIDYYNRMYNKKNVNVSETVYMHVDMDCFFASVGIRNMPELEGVPVVVTHSSKDSNPNCSTEGSMSEIASCSYEARKFGIRNGMHLGKAKKLCPDLKTIPYDFDSYLEVAKTLYEIASRFTHSIQVGSCDELYLDLIDILKLDGDNFIIDPLLFAEYLRSIIKTETGCPASCGIGGNLLTCKLATKRAKPNGQFWLRTTDVVDVMKEMKVRDLVGIGRNIEMKLQSLGVENCGQLQQMPLEKLKSEFGIKLGQRLFDMCRGKDNRSIQTDRIRKSISAEINYGIRLQSFSECENLLAKLSEELSRRLIEANMVGSHLVLKLMVRHPEASVESVKYLGHGVCDHLSKSVKLSNKINDASSIANQVIGLFKKCNQDVKDLRGVGLVMQKLESSNKPNLDSKKISNYFLPKSYCQKTDSKDEHSGSTTITLVGDNDNDEEEDENECLIVEYCSNGELEDNGLNDSRGFVLTESTSGKTTSSSADTNNKVFKTKHQKAPTGRENVIETKSQQLTINQLFGADSLKKKIFYPDTSTDTDTIDFLSKLGQTSVGALKTAISQWVSNESAPDIEDCVLIRNQLTSMVSDKVTDVYESIMILKMGIDSEHGGTKNEDVWKSCYINIVQSIQKVCFKHYGAFLELD